MNSPLIAVKAELYTIKKEIEKTEFENKENIINHIKNIENGMQNIGTTVNSIRDQIRTTGDKPKVEFALLELVEGIKMLMGHYFRENSCVFNIEIKENIKIYGESNKLDRVITNIVKNSVDAYLSQGTTGEINLRAHKEDNKCIIEIEDFAGGIDEKIEESLLKKMVSSKGKEGTGFGLFFSYQIITGEFKGKMSYENYKGKGTKFILEIPLEEQK